MLARFSTSMKLGGEQVSVTLSKNDEEEAPYIGIDNELTYEDGSSFFFYVDEAKALVETLQTFIKIAETLK